MFGKKARKYLIPLPPGLMLIFGKFVIWDLPNTPLIRGGWEEYINFFHIAIIFPLFLARIVDKLNNFTHYLAL